MRLASKDPLILPFFTLFCALTGSPICICLEDRGKDIRCFSCQHLQALLIGCKRREVGVFSPFPLGQSFRTSAHYQATGSLIISPSLWIRRGRKEKNEVRGCNRGKTICLWFPQLCPCQRSSHLMWIGSPVRAPREIKAIWLSGFNAYSMQAGKKGTA